jgi:NADPH:quinone reductase-like Zn-dependent oxidoreductase
VFVNSAAGSAVARLVTTIALRRGLRPINIVRSKDGAATLKARFPNVPTITTEDRDWRDRLIAEAGARRPRVALDPVGGSLGSEIVDLLDVGGTLLLYGDLAGSPMRLQALSLVSRRLAVRGVSIGQWAARTSEDDRRRDIAAAVDLARTAANQFEIAAEYDLSQITEAVRHAERPGKFGTVLLTS